MQSLGRAGKLGDLYDVRLDLGEMVRLYCLSVIREGGNYNGVSFPGRGTCRLHEEIERLFPGLAERALDLMEMDMEGLTTERVIRDLGRVYFG
jgi:hypothetical protein